MEKLIEQMDDEFGKSVHPQALELEKVRYVQYIPFGKCEVLKRLCIQPYAVVYVIGFGCFLETYVNTNVSIQGQLHTLYAIC